MADLYDLSERRPVGEIPKRMHEYGVRQYRFGQPRVAVPRQVIFFFQAEDGIRDLTVTGVQTCALPICPRSNCRYSDTLRGDPLSRAAVDAGAVGAVGGEDLLVHLPARRARPLLRRGSEIGRAHV